MATHSASISLLVSCEHYHACHNFMPSVQSEGVCTDSVEKDSIGAIGCKTVDHKQRDLAIRLL